MNQLTGAFKIFIAAILFCSVGCNLQLCGQRHTILMESMIHKEIRFKRASSSITHVFSYATINITSYDAPFTVDRKNKSSYLSLIMSGDEKKTCYSKQLSCFEDFAISLTLDEPSKIQVVVLPKRFDGFSFFIFLVGCAIFINAKSFSRSVTFLYASFASVGVLASCLILLFLLYRLVPYKRMMGFLLTIGSGMWLYFLESIQSTLGALITNHPYHVAVYLATSALLSISLLYYFGVPANDRALNLLQWSMQLLAIYLIYIGSYSKAFSVTVIVVLTAFQFLSFYKISSYLLKKCIPRKLLLMVYPQPKPRFLSMEEYDQQCREATERSLRELKEYCRSPKCDSWKVVSRLKDPKRFARFLEDGEQFTNDELDGYYIDEDDEQQQGNSIGNDDDSIELDLTTTAVATNTAAKRMLSNGGHKHISRSGTIPLPPPNEWHRGGWISEDEKNESF